MLTTDATGRLRLGLFGLAPSESRYLQALMRLMGSSSLDFPWEFSDHGTLDAILIDPRYADPAAPAVRNLGKHTLIISDDNPQDLPGTISRPIHLDKFEAWLLMQARRLRGSSAFHPMPTMADAGYGAVRAGKSAESIDAEDDTQHDVVGIDSRQFRLLRWPPAALLQRDQRRIRMATLMSKRPMTASELSKASQEPPERCMVFLKLLQSFDLVEISDRPVISEIHIEAERPRRYTPPPASRSLVGSIRRRLGL